MISCVFEVSIPMSLSIESVSEQIKVSVDGDLFFNYSVTSASSFDHPQLSHHCGGFERICAKGGRTLTSAPDGDHPACWIQNCISSENREPRRLGMMTLRRPEIRRGAVTVGFRQNGYWYDSENIPLLEEIRSVRDEEASSEGRAIDIHITLKCITAEPIWLDRKSGSMFQAYLAHQLLPSSGGQIRNSQENYDVRGIRGSRAQWCAAVGVVDGATVGMLILNHSANPESIPEWEMSSDGLIGPVASSARLLFDKDKSLSWKYRIVAHTGYVDVGWCNQQLNDFMRI